MRAEVAVASGPRHARLVRYDPDRMGSHLDAVLGVFALGIASILTKVRDTNHVVMFFFVYELLKDLFSFKRFLSP